jgi:hypothetical protein
MDDPIRVFAVKVLAFSAESSNIFGSGGATNAGPRS